MRRRVEISSDSRCDHADAARHRADRLPNMPFDKESNDPVGTGPYVVESKSNEPDLLKRHDAYWGAKPDVTRATYVWRSESAIGRPWSNPAKRT